MAYGQGSVSSSEMNAHKTMAGGKSTGNFGVGSFPVSPKQSLDASNGGELPDSARGAGPGVGGGKSSHAMQAAPDHGRIKDHFKR